MTKASLLFATLLSAASLHATPGYKITGNVKGGMEGMKIYLQYADAGWADHKSIDSATLHNGRFSLSGTVSSPRFCNILFRDEKAHPHATYEDKIISLFVENAPIKVDAIYDSLGMQLDGFSGQKPGAVTISGSKSHAAYAAYAKAAGALTKHQSAVFMQYIDVINSKEDTSSESRYHKAVPLTVEMDAAAAAVTAFNMDFVQHHAPDAVNAFVAANAVRYGDVTSKQVDTLIAYFKNAKDTGFLVKHFKEIAPGYGRTAIGAEIIDMHFVDSSGKSFAVKDYIGKGKYVMLECWASWCGPCRADIPHLKAMYKDYHPQGFEIISVSLDSEKSKWLKALNQEQMPWMQLSDLHAFDGELPKAYHINGIPHCLLFDPQGRLVTTNMRGSWMVRRLEEMYGDHFSKL